MAVECAPLPLPKPYRGECEERDQGQRTGAEETGHARDEAECRADEKPNRQRARRRCCHHTGQLTGV
jgi:hypothetical protein